MELMVAGSRTGHVAGLLAFMPEEQRNFIPIVAGNEAIVEFVRAAHSNKG